MDKLDHLLALYAEQCVKEEAAYFLGLDVSGIEYNEQIKRRMLRYAFKRSRYERKQYATKVILVACLVAMSVAFTACVSIPKIREALWDAVVEWYDDHISVKFEEIHAQTIETSEPIKTDDGNIPTETTGNHTEGKSTPPKTIEQKAYASYLPDKCVLGEEISTSKSLMVNYYSETGEWKFSLNQAIIDSQSWELDYEEDAYTHLQVDDMVAILIEYPDDIGCFSLTWQDEYYTYNIYGYFTTISELVSVAKGISLK